MTSQPVVSRHRLPQPYRALLVALWIAPTLILLFAVVYGNGMQIALFNPRFLILIGLMALPALYVWQEGVDVLDDGLITRIFVPQHYAFTELSRWQIREYPPGRTPVLTITDHQRRRILWRHTAHLTDVDVLVSTLEAKL